METQSILLETLMASWVVCTAVLTVLLIYRGTLSAKEDDQIFLDAAEQHYYQDQQEIIAKMTRLVRPIIAAAVISGVLLLTSTGLWLYNGLKSF